MPSVNELPLPPATYAVRGPLSLLALLLSCVFLSIGTADACSGQRHMAQGAPDAAPAPQDLVIMPDKDAEAVPFAVWDPDRPAEHSTPFSKLTQPMYVDLHPGDMLYLPSLW